MTTRIHVTGIKVEQLQERHALPSNLVWNGKMPESYSLHFIYSEKEKDKTIVVCSDGFGGKVAWATYNRSADIIGKKIEMDEDEKLFLEAYYPRLLEAIDSL